VIRAEIGILLRLQHPNIVREPQTVILSAYISICQYRIKYVLIKNVDVSATGSPSILIVNVKILATGSLLIVWEGVK
jgi:hypothetical protein